MQTVIGVIGGSGVYEIDGLQDTQWISVESPFGEPSDDLLMGTLNGIKMVFLPRHGRGHVQTPSSINYRANIDVLKRAGVTDIISVSACADHSAMKWPPVILWLSTNLLTAHLHEKNRFSGRAASPMCLLLIPLVRGSAKPVFKPPKTKASPYTTAAPTSPWKARNFPPWQKAKCTARRGAVT